MNATVTCPHGMPSPGSCVDCMNDGNLPPAPRPARPEVASKPFAARFPGHCRTCNMPIHEGQQIVRMTDESHRHDLCERSGGLF